MIARTSRTVLGLLLAFVAGTAVGMLWAPAAGARTRKKLVKKGGALGEKLGGAIGGRAAAAWESAGELVAKGKEKLSA